MSTQVASLFGVLSLDDKDFQQGLKDADKGMKSAQDRLKDFSSGIKNVGAGMIAVSGPIVAFGVTAVQAAMESQQAVAQLDAVIKSTGGSAGVTADHAQALASSLQNLTMFGDEAVMSAESMLLTFTNIGAAGGVFDQATLTVLNMSQALGQDLTSSAMQLGKALNDPVAGITALTRVGVTFTQQQKDQIEAMVAAGNVAGAQSLILAELNREFGGSAIAAGSTFAGSLEILKNKFGEVQEKIGGVFLPMLTDITTKIGPIVDNIAEWVEKNPTLVMQIGALAVGGVLFGGAMVVLGTVLPAVVAGIGMLLSPVVILAVALGALVYAAAKLYPGGIPQLLTDASKAAQDLANIGLILLIDTLNKASIAAQELIQMGLFVLFDTLNKASIAAGQLIVIVGIGFTTALALANTAISIIVSGIKDFITQHQFAFDRITDLIAAIALMRTGLLLYNIVTAAAAAVSTALAAGASAVGAAIAAVTSPVVVATLAVWALISAWHELQRTWDYLKAGGQDVSTAAANQIKNNGLTHDQFMKKGFDAAVAQFGDLGARVWWDQGAGRVTIEQLWLNAVAQAGNTRAMGGPVDGGTSYLVGEQGPELFTPSTSGNISTASQTAGMMSGQPMVVNVYANTYEGGQAAARGFTDKARALGYSVP
jgi:hypothetical protein